jgi:hypothetical protein
MLVKFSNWMGKKTYTLNCSFICFQNNSMSRWLLNRGWLWWPNHGKLQWHWVVVFCSDDILTLSEVVISSTVFHWLLKWRGATDRMKFVIPWIGSTTCAIISKTIDIVHGTASNCSELPWLTAKCNDESRVTSSSLHRRTDLNRLIRCHVKAGTTDHGLPEHRKERKVLCHWPDCATSSPFGFGACPDL